MNDWTAAHGELGDASLAFARYLLERANTPGPVPVAAVTTLYRNWPLRQRVPLLLDQAAHDGMAADALTAGALLMEVPRRLTRHAPFIASMLYGMDAARAIDLLDRHGFYDVESYRLDMVRGPAGFSVLEANAGAHSSGFYGREWLDLYTAMPVTARFLEEQDVTLSLPDTFDIFLARYVALAAALPHVRGSGTVGVALAVEPEAIGGLTELLTARVRPIAEAHGLRAAVSVVDSYALFEPDGGRLHAAGRPVDLLVRMLGGMINPTLYSLQRDGALIMIDTPTSYFSVDKRNFAFLTGQRLDGCYTDEECAAIDRLFPWTTLLLADAITFEGTTLPLRTLLYDAQDRFVLKSARGFGGKDVLVGGRLPTDVWRAAVDARLGDPNWLAQEFRASYPYILHDERLGFCEHEVIWGYFVLGGVPGGGTIRMKPRLGSSGIVNVAAGGLEGLFCLADTGRISA